MRRKKGKKISKEEKKKRKKAINNFVNSLLVMLVVVGLIASIFFLIYGVRTFWVGYHSLDIGQNLRHINCVLDPHNITFAEFPSENVVLSGEQTFRLGVAQLSVSFWMILIFSFLSGLFLSYLVVNSLSLINKGGKNES